MAKYSYEFKLQVVQAYLDGEGGYRYLSKKYGVPSKRDIEKWVFAYKAFGKDGLMRSRKNESYSFEFKLHVVELYLIPLKSTCFRRILKNKKTRFLAVLVFFALLKLYFILI